MRAKVPCSGGGLGGPHRCFNLGEGGVDQGGRADDDGGDGFVPVRHFADARGGGRVFPDVDLTHVQPALRQRTVQCRAEAATGPPVELHLNVAHASSERKYSSCACTLYSAGTHSARSTSA